MRPDRWKLSLKEQLPLYMFLAVLFIVGVAFGAFMYHSLTLEQQQNMTDELNRYLQIMQTGAFPDEAQSFWERALFHGKWVLLIWLLGLTVVGIPLIFALDFLKGVLVGFAVGTLVSAHAWKGVFLSLVSVAPPNLIIVPALLMASVSAVSFSLFIVKNRLLNRRGDLLPALLSHSAAAVMLFVVLCGAALLEAYVSPLLISWAAAYLGEAGAF
jgi:stage II sporulation protein M